MHLLDKIIDHVGIEFSTSIKARETPAGKPLMHKDESSLGINCVYNYRVAVGILSYLQVSTRPEIPMAVHQCARFFNNPRLVHKRAVRRIAKYLASTSYYVYFPDVNRWLSTRVVVYKPNILKGVKRYVHAVFLGGWDQVDADNA